MAGFSSPDNTAHRKLLHINTAGCVDNGKSTLIGRLMYDSGGIPLDVIERIAKKSGAADGKALNFAFFTDGLKEEQARGITIDVARHYVAREGLDLIIADTPGHQEFTRNMMTGTSTSDATLILVDATKGIVEQNRRHAYIAALLGVPHIVILVNKMDLVGYSQSVYDSLQREFQDLLSTLDSPPPRCIPIAALHGENVVLPSRNMPWYEGSTVVQLLEEISSTPKSCVEDLRVIVQWIAKAEGGSEQPELYGEVASGEIKAGDGVVVGPHQIENSVASLRGLNGPLAQAHFPASVRIKLTAPHDVRRGDIISHLTDVPSVGSTAGVQLSWMSEEPLHPGERVLLKVGTNTTGATVKEISHEVDITTYQKRSSKGHLAFNDIASAVISTDEPIAWDSFKKSPSTGRFILIDSKSKRTVGAGIVDRVEDKRFDPRITHSYDPETGTWSRGIMTAKQLQDQRSALKEQFDEQGRPKFHLRLIAGRTAHRGGKSSA